jgi:hypothetical protein
MCQYTLGFRLTLTWATLRMRQNLRLEVCCNEFHPKREKHLSIGGQVETMEWFFQTYRHIIQIKIIDDASYFLECEAVWSNVLPAIQRKAITHQPEYTPPYLTVTAVRTCANQNPQLNEFHTLCDGLHQDTLTSVFSQVCSTGSLRNCIWLSVWTNTDLHTSIGFHSAHAVWEMRGWNWRTDAVKLGRHECF